MPVETELKLRIAPGQLAKLKRHALLKSLQLARPTTRRLYNVYFDTPKLELHHAEMALRLRRSGGQWLQTLKGGGSVQGGLHQRNEWEMPVSGPALDFSLPQVDEWKTLLPKHLRKKLQPAFVTDFSRSSRILLWQGAQIELCIDHGEVSTAHLSSPICELELELKSGEPQQLFGLALAILEIVPFELESISKAEQGFRLLSGYVEQPVKALPLVLDRHDDLNKALPALLWAAVQHLQNNLRGVREGNDAEYLHQMRVALRRLRVLLHLAESIVADVQLAAFRQEIASLGTSLGKIREWDVFIAQIVRPMCARMPQDRSLQKLLLLSQQQRDVCYSALRNDAQMRKVQRLLLRFGIWMHGSYWQQHELVGLNSRDFAATYLSKLAKNFAQTEAQLNLLDTRKLHDLRIACKKLRYGAEFFASLFAGHQSSKFLTGLSEIQDILGQINDDAVVNRLLGKLHVPQDTVVLVKGWVEHDMSQQLILFQNALGKFNRLQSYWEH